tara:strand:- start:112211 stop:113044 length:834 start_codon:yes stop_codon:yes gene_type:complete
MTIQERSILNRSLIGFAKWCGAILLCAVVTPAFADDGDDTKPEAVRDGEYRRPNALRDGGPREGGPRDRDQRDGQRFRGLRERMQQGRPDGQAGGRFDRPGDGMRQGGGLATIPMFRALDRNSDGRIDAAELDMAIASLRTLDKNGDGELTAPELLPFGSGGGMAQKDGAERMGRPGGGRPDGGRPGLGQGQGFSIDQIFTQLDRDGDDVLSQDEMPERLAANFDRVDQDGDGKVSKDEMRVARDRMMQMGQRGRGGRPESDEPAGGTRPRRPESEE